MPQTPVIFPAAVELSILNDIIGGVFNGVSAYDQSGWFVSSAGDINGDGVSDLIIGARGAAPGGRSQAGSSFVVFGTNSSFGAVLELSALNGANGFRINGVSAGDLSGVSVANAGDINGDGISDLIIGAVSASPSGRTNAGSSFVVFGANSSFGAVLELSALNGANGFRINGVSAGDASGVSVNSAGDINNDGLNDLIIGANGASANGRPGVGGSFVVFGARSGFGTALELSSLNGVNGFRINGISGNSGNSVASVGDINGDGISDLIMGAATTSPGNRTNAGSSFIVFGDSIQISSNQLAISEGKSQTLTPSNFNISVSPKYAQYTIIQPQHGRFEYTTQPGITITSFSGQDVIMGRVNFTHDNSELAPSYSVTFSHILATTVYAYPANITFINQLPVLVNNSLIINQGQTLQIDSTMLAAIDPGNAQNNPDIVFNILSNSNGFFSSYSFAQSQIWDGGVYFTQGGNIRAPRYIVSISRGGVTIGPAYPTIDFDTTPVLQQNHFDICQGQTKSVTPQMLSAIQPGNFSSNPLIFSIQNLQYGRFERHEYIGAGVPTSNFSQAEIQNGSIQFIQDGSSNPPSFVLTLTDNRVTTAPYFAGIYFTYAPILRINILTLNQGQTVVLNNNMLNAFNANANSEDLVFTVSNVQQGHFIFVNTTQNISQFNQSQLNTNQIAFKADGSSVAPSYLVSVQNECSRTNPAPVFVNFNSAPVLTSNQLTITNGQPVILTSTELSATDKETPLVDLGFTVAGVQHGYFDTITLPGTPITVFSQQMVLNGAIRFVPENNFLLPAYNVSVSDGILWDGPEAALVRLGIPSVNTFTTIESSNTVRNAIIGGTVSGLISLGFLALRCYLGKRMNGALKNILVVENSTVEEEQEAWKRETLSPVVKEIFSKFKTTGFIGYRNEENTKAYVKGVELLLLAIQKQGVEVHFPKLSVTERIRLLTAIVDEMKIQLVKPSGLGGFIKPAFTADELKVAAPAIAKVVAMTVNKEKAADRIRHTVVDRPKTDSSAYPVMVRDNEIELASVSEQKFAADAANQDLIEQSSLEKRVAAIEGHFSKSEERFAKAEENSGLRFAKIEERSAKIEASLERLLGHQSGSSDKPKMRLVN